MGRVSSDRPTGETPPQPLGPVSVRAVDHRRDGAPETRGAAAADGAEVDGGPPAEGEAAEAEDAVRGWSPFREPSNARPGRSAKAAAVVLAVALAFGAGIGVGRLTVAEAGTASSAPPPGSGAPASAAPGASFPLAGLPSDGALLGRSDAKVQLTYWADFQCPYCARFAQQVLPQLAPRIADGTVSVLHRDFVFLGPESLDAAVAVRCAGQQGRFWEMHEAVYAMQAGENQGAFALPRLRQIATLAGLEPAAFDACLGAHDVLVDVLADTAAGVRAGVSSTPTIDIPGRTFLGVPDPATLVGAIDDAARAGTVPTPGPTVAPSGDPWAGTSTAGRTAGQATARVTVELWVDYQATGMPALVQTLEPELRTRVASGTARLVLRDLATLGDESIAAASLVRCTADADGPAWFVHDILGAAARGANAGVFNDRSLLWLAAKLGFDVRALDTCMADPATTAAVRAETAVGTGLGLTAAPAVIVKAGDAEAARFSGSSVDPAKVLAAVDAAAK